MTPRWPNPAPWDGDPAQVAEEARQLLRLEPTDPDITARLVPLSYAVSDLVREHLAEVIPFDDAGPPWTEAGRNFARSPGGTLTNQFSTLNGNLASVPGFAGHPSAMQWTRTKAGSSRFTAKVDYPLGVPIAISVYLSLSEALTDVTIALRPNAASNAGAVTLQPAGPLPAGEQTLIFTAVSPTDPSNGSGSSLALIFASGAIGGTVQMTGIQVEAGSLNGPYFDGDTVDTATDEYGWTGQAGGSVSTWLTAPAAGTEPPEIPEPVHQACISALLDAYKRKDTSFGITGAWSSDGINMRVSPDWLAGVLLTLQPYRERFGVA